MKKSDPESIPSRETDGGSGGPQGGQAAEDSRCTCRRCRLYRWYPPMLVASTVMTALFCFMYLTKPVFLQAPNQTLGGSERVEIQDHNIVRNEGPGEVVPESVEIPKMRPQLDPDLSVFPPTQPRVVDPVLMAIADPGYQEPPAPVIPAAEVAMPVRIDVASHKTSEPIQGAGGFQPMRISRSETPLFQSLTAEDLARIAAKKAARANPEVEDTIATAVAVVEESMVAIDEVDEVPEEIGVGIVVAEPQREEAVDTPVIRASFMGEFYSEESEDDPSEEDLQKTAMR